MSNREHIAARRARQKTIVTVLGIGLIVGGAIVAFALKRMPFPLRILVGFTDIVAGFVLVIAAQRKL